MKTTAIARWTGLIVGLSLALVTLVQARIPAGTGQVPAFASLVAERSVTLGVTPVGQELLSDRRLLPGASVSGLVEVSNLTDAAVAVEPRLHSRRGEAPAALRLELTAGRRAIYTGTLSGLDATVRLNARAEKRLRFRISAPRSRAREIKGRSIDLVLRFTTEKAGR